MKYLSASLAIVPSLCVLGGRSLCCLICVRWGGGYVGYIRNALEKNCSEHPRFACCTDDMFQIFCLFWTVPVLLGASFRRQAAAMSSYKFTPRAVASPDAPQRPLVRKRTRSGGVEWVQVSRTEPGSRAKKRCTAESQQPACTPKEHHIL